MRPQSSILLLFVVACAGTPPPGTPSDESAAAVVPPATTAAPPTSPPPPARKERGDTAPFGGERWGFAEASSAKRRFVVLRLFAGEAPPSFGHHGEASVGSTLVLFDLVEGSQREIDEIIDVAGRRRFLIVDDGKTLLLDTATANYAELAADQESDRNSCLPPRHAAFSADGSRIAWVEPGSKSLRIRDLETGTEWSIESQERIWRGWPDNDGHGAVLAEVDATAKGWPIQSTSCACRWCNRFARSYGFYGWRGPAFDLEHVAEDGARSDGDPSENQDPWHGESDSGCELEPSKRTEVGLERGPWRWVCD